MAASSGILPTYQRFVNGVPVALARRSFRPREKYVILLVFATFGLVCFGTFFFLPEFRSGGTTADSVYKVYDQFKKAGPEFLLPPPPLLDDSQKIIRHDRGTQDDPHVLDDMEKLRAKIAQDSELKVLEKPDIYAKTSSTSKTEHLVKAKGVDDVVRDSEIMTVPPAYSDHYPDINHGEDPDPKVRERRNKIKEVSFVLRDLIFLIRLMRMFTSH
ncbi:hypothetical protein QE152_g13172 [Popillia japonica]|uniref:Uncharacterized protein n=1 Tax=Popillia japonica TaxID=7064 RepID=A0AAW1LEM7_POPJA